MKHKEHDRTDIDHLYFFAEIELIAESPIEKQAIQNMEDMSATQTQRDLVENYLLFSVYPSCTFVEMIEHYPNRYMLKYAKA